jgi:hypothetical protein
VKEFVKDSHLGEAILHAQSNFFSHAGFAGSHHAVNQRDVAEALVNLPCLNTSNNFVRQFVLHTSLAVRFQVAHVFITLHQKYPVSPVDDGAGCELEFGKRPLDGYSSLRLRGLVTLRLRLRYPRLGLVALLLCLVKLLLECRQVLELIAVEQALRLDTKSFPLLL